ncbi:MAG: gliding motility lipoprotein GldB [Bacteroidetes bacterium]|nr:gliding motility lipoprotein GldB [Bacteroidota bacterium]MBS1539448.1 gliding motility lipoprotein GldB [Bacteroidota bacterium]
MKKTAVWACWMLLLVGVASCDSDREVQCLHDPQKKIAISFTPIEDSLPAIRNKKDLAHFFSRHLEIANIFFKRQNYPNDSAFINHYYRWFSHPSMDTLLLETKKVFGDGSELKNEFQVAFSNMSYFYPGFKPPHVVTLITGMETDLFVSDSLIIVGLDYYLGKKAKYRPDMHQYMLQRFEKNYIVPSAVLLFGIDTRYNHTVLSDHTVLADMVAYGKAYYFAKQMLPCAPDSIFIGYTGKDIAGAEANQDVIWKKLIEDEALFSTSQQIKQRYLNERPKTYEIGNDCPGRIATWVGWKIVRTYMKENPTITLPQLMATAQAEKILKESKYRPETH